MAQVCSSNCYSYNQMLLKDLFSVNANYSSAISPGSDTNSLTYVVIYFTLIKLLSLTTSGTISVVAGLTLGWFDQRLTWNSTKYNNITVIEAPTNSVWTPHISLMNGVSQTLAIDLTTDGVASLNYEGKVQLAVARQFDATCPMNLKYFPFDSQTCTLTIQNMDLRGYQYSGVNFTLSSAANLEIYSSSGEFELAKASLTPGTRQLLTYAMNLSIVNVNLTFVRNPSYYIGTVAVPALLLLLSSGMVFLLPSDNSVKIAMACSLMVSLYVLQQAVARLLPSSQSSSLLSIGIMIELGLGCYSLACAMLQVALRAAQPPLSERCVKFLLACEPYLCSGRAPRSTNVVEPLKVDANGEEDGNATALDKTQRTETRDELTTAVYALINWHAGQVERAESLQQQKADHAKLWKVMDNLLSFVFLSIYLAVGITSVLLLFGAILQ